MHADKNADERITIPAQPIQLTAERISDASRQLRLDPAHSAVPDVPGVPGAQLQGDRRQSAAVLPARQSAAAAKTYLGTTRADAAGESGPGAQGVAGRCML